MLQKDLIIPYNGAHASLPDGFTRETTLDDKTVKAVASGVNPGTSGGSATHTHSSPSHTHTMASHSHTGNTSTNNQEDNASSDFTEDKGSTALRNDNHYHNFTLTTLTSESVDSVAVTYSAVSNLPPYVEVIFIKSNSQLPVPDGGLAIWNSATLPNGFQHADGTNGTLDTRNKYLKGAPTGADAGATGGSTENSHTIAHTHSTSHGHSGTSGANSSEGSVAAGDGFNNEEGVGGHTHNMTLSSKALTSASNSAISAQAETVEPAHRKQLIIENTSGVGQNPIGMRALWLLPLANIPLGWKFVDLSSRYIKGANSTGEIGDTGGSNTHTHAAQSHTHTIPSHNHTGSVGTVASGSTGRGRGGAVAARYWELGAGFHTVSSVSSVAGSLNSSTTTANSSDNQPPHVQAAIIELVFDPAPLPPPDML